MIIIMMIIIIIPLALSKLKQMEMESPSCYSAENHCANIPTACVIFQTILSRSTNHYIEKLRNTAHCKKVICMLSLGPFIVNSTMIIKPLFSKGTSKKRAWRLCLTLFLKEESPVCVCVCYNVLSGLFLSIKTCWISFILKKLSTVNFSSTFSSLIFPLLPQFLGKKARLIFHLPCALVPITIHPLIHLRNVNGAHIIYSVLKIGWRVRWNKIQSPKHH